MDELTMDEMIDRQAQEFHEQDRIGDGDQDLDELGHLAGEQQDGDWLRTALVDIAIRVTVGDSYAWPRLKTD